MTSGLPEDIRISQITFSTSKPTIGQPPSLPKNNSQNRLSISSPKCPMKRTNERSLDDSECAKVLSTLQFLPNPRRELQRGKDVLQHPSQLLNTTKDLLKLIALPPRRTTPEPVAPSSSEALVEPPPIKLVTSLDDTPSIQVLSEIRLFVTSPIVMRCGKLTNGSLYLTPQSEQHQKEPSLCITVPIRKILQEQELPQFVRRLVPIQKSPSLFGKPNPKPSK